MRGQILTSTNQLEALTQLQTLKYSTNQLPIIRQAELNIWIIKWRTTAQAPVVRQEPTCSTRLRAQASFRLILMTIANGAVPTRPNWKSVPKKGSSGIRATSASFPISMDPLLVASILQIEKAMLQRYLAKIANSCRYRRCLSVRRSYRFGGRRRKRAYR